MAESSVRKHWWPDLTRFGARLSVAWNPSVGRNFLKLAILDREQFARASGFEPGEDLLRVMREAGFSYLNTEVRSGADQAHDAAVGENLSVREVERRANEAKRRLYFYSPAMSDVSEAFIRRFLPAFTAAELTEFELRDIKHFDHQYLSPEAAKAFIARLQHIDGAEPGVYYSIPRDRKAQRGVERSAMPLNLLLEYADLAQVEAPAPGLDPNVTPYLDFHPVRAIESAVRVATPGLDGYPIKAPRLSACAIVYPTYEAAVAANGGDIEGVEREKFEWGVPIAFAYPEPRLLVLRDARFLEFNPLRIPEPEVPLPGAQASWSFLRHMQAVRERYEGLRESGLLDPAAWASDTVVAQVDREFEFVAGAMRLAVRPFGKKTGLVDAASLMALSGLKPSVFETVFDRGFQHFLTQFRHSLQEALSRRKAELAAAQPIQPDVRAVIDAMRRRSATPAAGERVDAGEKIGGARKDLARVALRTDEIAAMNARELDKLVIKDHVWPKLDFLAMRERGVLPEVAHLIRELRNAFPVHPRRGGFNTKQASLERRAKAELTPQRCEHYVRAAALIVSELAEVRTLEELAGAYYRIIEKSGVSAYAYLWDADHWFCDGAGYKLLRNELTKVSGKPGLNGAVNVDYYSLQLKARRARTATAGGWAWAIKPERAADAADAIEIDARPPKPTKPGPELEHLEHIRRTGPDHRAGASVTEAMFIARYGFRAIEYGNWLPQGERQLVLDHAHDAFGDLAQTLRLPERAMGLGGTLAIAFGARGNGGKGAAQAHFEPLKSVMNLTRLSGAGALAHEWFHALDYWLAQHYQLSSIAPASEVPLGKVIAGRAGPAFALHSVISFISTRDETFDEMVRRRCHVKNERGESVTLTTQWRTELGRRLRALERALPPAGVDGTFRARAAAIAAHHQQAVPELAPYDIHTFPDPEALRGALETAFREQGGDPAATTPKHILSVAHSLASNAQQRIATLLNDCETFTPGKHKVASRMLADAKYYDGFRSRPYWSTPVEMVARAFEGYVQDAIERQQDRVSQYLVHGAQERPHAEYAIYPRGPERTVAREAFDTLFAAIAKQLTPALAEPPAQRAPQISEP
ncbi:MULTISPECIES: LPD1 domain-containing protein [Cupriavidus]